MLKSFQGIRAKVAVFGEGVSAERVTVLLEEREFDLAGSAADPESSGSDRPLVSILCPFGTLAAASREIAAQEAETAGPVIVVCEEVRPGDLRGALAAGARGVVLADELETTLEPTIAAVEAGLVCVPRREGTQVEPSTLSTREKQILGLVVMGYMNSEIAEQLFVAVSTVKSHLSSAFAKLGVRSRSEAVELIVDPERGLGMGILALGGEPLQSGKAAS